jgi:L,D-transpeptidase catalytic domain
MSLCGIRYPSDSSIEWECRKLTRRDYPEKLFGKYWRDVLRFNRLDRRHFIDGLSIKAPVQPEEVDGFAPLPDIYPDAAGDAKFILVNQSEMFLGAYEYGDLVFAFPVAVGIGGHRVPNGEFRIDAVDRGHTSNLYTIEEKGMPYPMHYGLRFFLQKRPDGWTGYWIHGRDLPGYPASHGCIGLYDEEMQKEVYKEPKKVILDDAKKLYRWVIGSHADSGRFHTISYGPRVLIVGEPPI